VFDLNAVCVDNCKLSPILQNVLGGYWKRSQPRNQLLRGIRIRPLKDRDETRSHLTELLIDRIDLVGQLRTLAPSPVVVEDCELVGTSKQLAILNKRAASVL
jgi:hypothetical protein